MLLAGAQACVLGTIGAYAVLAPVALAALGQREGTIGLLWGLYFGFAAASARTVGRFMDRAGRRPGLLIGYLLLLLGSVGSSVAARMGAAPGMLVTAFLVGGGAGAALLGRGAVADMYPPEERGRALGWLLAAGTVGSVGGPLLVGAIREIAEGSGGPSAGAWGPLPALAAVGLVLVSLLRPDPATFATVGPGGRRGSAPVFARRPAAAAVAAIASAQVLMVSIMGIAPVRVAAHGAGRFMVSLVISLHLGGMFAFSPIVGGILDRFGRRRGLLLAGAVLTTGAVLTLVGTTVEVFTAGLFLIGLGWSGAYLGSTAVVSDLTTSAERGGALGTADLVTQVCAAGGVVGGSYLAQAAGFPTLAAVGAVLGVVPIALFAPQREGRPGTWLHDRAAAAVRSETPPV